MNYTTAIRQLAALQHNAAVIKTTMKDMLATVTENEPYHGYKDQAAMLKVQIEELDHRIRQIAAAAMKANGTRPDHPAVKVKAHTSYAITNSTAAWEWCKERLPVALVIDEALLIKYMREFVTDADLPEFVKVEHGYQATISPDLSQYLNESE
jgi:phage host-nuclease inhibitor protein Gam